MPMYGKVVVIKRNGQDGSIFPILKKRTVLGSDKVCDIRIQLPYIAQTQCSITINDGHEAYLTNLSDNHPTLLNKQSFTNENMKLKHGDIITVGDRSFRFVGDIRRSSHFVAQSSRRSRTMESLLNKEVKLKSPVMSTMTNKVFTPKSEGNPSAKVKPKIDCKTIPRLIVTDASDDRRKHIVTTPKTPSFVPNGRLCVPNSDKKPTLGQNQYLKTPKSIMSKSSTLSASKTRRPALSGLKTGASTPINTFTFKAITPRFSKTLGQKAENSRLVSCSASKIFSSVTKRPPLPPRSITRNQGSSNIEIRKNRRSSIPNIKYRSPAMYRPVGVKSSVSGSASKIPVLNLHLRSPLLSKNIFTTPSSIDSTTRPLRHEKLEGSVSRSATENSMSPAMALPTLKEAFQECNTNILLKSTSADGLMQGLEERLTVTLSRELKKVVEDHLQKKAPISAISTTPVASQPLDNELAYAQENRSPLSVGSTRSKYSRRKSSMSAKSSINDDLNFKHIKNESRTSLSNLSKDFVITSTNEKDVIPSVPVTDKHNKAYVKCVVQIPRRTRTFHSKHNVDSFLNENDLATLFGPSENHNDISINKGTNDSSFLDDGSTLSALFKTPVGASKLRSVPNSAGFSEIKQSAKFSGKCLSDVSGNKKSPIRLKRKFPPEHFIDSFITEDDLASLFDIVDAVPKPNVVSDDAAKKIRSKNRWSLESNILGPLLKTPLAQSTPPKMAAATTATTTTIDSSCKNQVLTPSTQGTSTVEIRPLRRCRKLVMTDFVGKNIDDEKIESTSKGSGLKKRLKRAVSLKNNVRKTDVKLKMESPIELISKEAPMTNELVDKRSSRTQISTRCKPAKSVAKIEPVKKMKRKLEEMPIVVQLPTSSVEVHNATPKPTPAKRSLKVVVIETPSLAESNAKKISRKATAIKATTFDLCLDDDDAADAVNIPTTAKRARKCTTIETKSHVVDLKDGNRKANTEKPLIKSIQKTKTRRAVKTETLTDSNGEGDGPENIKKRSIRSGSKISVKTREKSKTIARKKNVQPTTNFSVSAEVVVKRPSRRQVQRSKESLTQKVVDSSSKISNTKLPAIPKNQPLNMRVTRAMAKK